MIHKIQEVFEGVIQAFEQKKRIRRNYRELNRLTDRELEDVGIHRCDIPRLVHEQVSDNYR